MDALYVGRPLYQPAGFNPFDGDTGRVVFWWLIPIYDVEAEFVEAEGWEAFEQLMWDLDVDPTDFTRDPWLDPPHLGKIRLIRRLDRVRVSETSPERRISGRVAEAAAAVEAVELVDLDPLDLLDALDDQLGDAVAAADLVVGGRVGVEQHALQLAAVGGVDDPRRVDERDAVAQREPAARHDEPGVAGRDGEGDARRHDRPPAAGLDDCALPGVEVEPGVAGMGVGRQRKVGIEADDGHRQHRRDPRGAARTNSRRSFRRSCADAQEGRERAARTSRAVAVKSVRPSAGTVRPAVGGTAAANTNHERDNCQTRRGADDRAPAVRSRRGDHRGAVRRRGGSSPRSSAGGSPARPSPLPARPRRRHRPGRGDRGRAHGTDPQQSGPHRHHHRRLLVGIRRHARQPADGPAGHRRPRRPRARRRPGRCSWSGSSPPD